MFRLLPRILPLVIALVIFGCSDDSTNAPATYSVSGTVHQAGTGMPIADAQVVATGHDDGRELGRANTGSDGAFTLKGLPAGKLDLTVSANGYAPVLFASLDAKTDAPSLGDMSVQLSPVDSCCSGLLILRVKNASGEALANKVVVIKKAGQVIDDPRTDANGKIMLADLCPGEYAIRIAVDGYRVYEAVFVINSECDPVELTAVLQTEAEVCCDGSLTVNVKDENGAGVSGAQVRVWKGGAILQTAFTDASGVAVFTDLCKGEYGVDVMKTGYTEREFTFAINGECDPVTKNVVVESLGCCSGVFTLIVRDGNGNPVANAKVLVKKNGAAISDPRSNENGQVTIDGLCAGEYVFIVSKEGFTSSDGSFVIDQNCSPVSKETTLAELCCSGVLTVTVTDTNSAPIEGATVKLWKGGAVKETIQTNAQGVAVIDGLCKGEYGVSVQKTGYQAREFTFAIGPDCAPYAKTVVLEP